MIMLKWIDKELSFSVYLQSRNNMIELYKDDSDYAFIFNHDIMWQRDYNIYCKLGYVGLSAFTWLG